MSNNKQETHICKWCGAETSQSDDKCYAKPKSSIEWLSNQTYELFEQYSEGNFDRIQLNKLVLKATEQAKEMHKKEIENAWKMGRYDSDKTVMSERFYTKQYYNETFNKH